MKKEVLHQWDVQPKDAIALQEKLRSLVKLTPLKKKIKTIAGADVSFNLYEKDVYAGIIVLRYPELTPVAHALVKTRAEFPYIPGLLSFREIPALLECFKKLTIIPDLIVVDGQGIAHPRRLGIASHLGVVLGIPTIGCAKSKLYGVGKIPTEPNQTEKIVDPKTNEAIGMYFKAKRGAKPLIISPGHLTTLQDTLAIISKTLRGYKLPEPTRQAHLLVNQFRKGDTK
jgi:deoxyribonuclease V